MSLYLVKVAAQAMAAAAVTKCSLAMLQATSQQYMTNKGTASLQSWP